MEKNTNEKSLVKVDNGIFSRFKRFWSNLFIKNKSKKISNKSVEEIGEIVEELPKENLNKTRKLFDYDAEDTSKENIENPGESFMEDNSEKIEENKIEAVTDDNKEESDINNDQTIYKTVEVDNSGEDTNVTYLFEKKQKSSAYEEKEELERKLMNYYESIKTGI